MIIAALLVLLVVFVAGYNTGHTAGQRWERGLRAVRHARGEPKQHCAVPVVDTRLRIIGAARLPLHHNTPEARN